MKRAINITCCQMPLSKSSIKHTSDMLINVSLVTNRRQLLTGFFKGTWCFSGFVVFWKFPWKQSGEKKDNLHSSTTFALSVVYNPNKAHETLWLSHKKFEKYKAYESFLQNARFVQLVLFLTFVQFQTFLAKQYRLNSLHWLKMLLLSQFSVRLLFLRLSSAKPTAPIILDGKRASDDEEDEDEQFLVMEAVTPHPDSPKTVRVGDMIIHGFDYEVKVQKWSSIFVCDRKLHMNSTLMKNMVSDFTSSALEELQTSWSWILSSNAGGLVKKILETKKDYELTPSSSKSKEQVCISNVSFFRFPLEGSISQVLSGPVLWAFSFWELYSLGTLF